MGRTRTSWTEKLHDSKGLPKTITIDAKWSKRWKTQAGDTCYIPSPLEVDALMKRIPKGRLVTINELRGVLAREHGTTIACPITTGIFAWIAAHAAVEGDPKKPATPYWRTLKTGGELNPKYPGGIAKLARLLRAEGHKIVTRGKRTFVADFEQALATL